MSCGPWRTINAAGVSRSFPQEQPPIFRKRTATPLNIIQPPRDWESFLPLRRYLAERAPWFQSEIKDILWIAQVQFERQLVLRYGEGRCWLAGDAAHQASPAGMHSMNLGLREAADLAGKAQIHPARSCRPGLAARLRPHPSRRMEAIAGIEVWSSRPPASLPGRASIFQPSSATSPLRAKTSTIF